MDWSRHRAVRGEWHRAVMLWWSISRSPMTLRYTVAPPVVGATVVGGWSPAWDSAPRVDVLWGTNSNSVWVIGINGASVLVVSPDGVSHVVKIDCASLHANDDACLCFVLQPHQPKG